MDDLFTIARKDGSGAIIWSEDQKRFIVEEYTVRDNTLKAISQMFNVRQESIRALLRREKIQITNKKIRDYPRNSNFFSIIDNPEKAYWLGFFYADGSVGKNDNSIKLAIKDKEHVEKFKTSLEVVNHKISEIIEERNGKQYYWYCINISDKQLHDDLVHWGCVPRKSWQDLSIPDIPNDLKWHFIRGVFDGDGCLSYSLERNSFALSFVGGKHFMEEIRSFFEKEKVALIQNVKSKITYTFRISGKVQVLHYLDLIYKGSDETIRLNRKYEKYIELLNYSAICH